MNAKALFVNTSQHANGNTVAMGRQLLKGIKYETLNLNDYRINFIGQNLDGDQFSQVFSKLQQFNTLIIGTPVYWHTVSGSLKVLIDRISEGGTDLSGKRMVFFYQGSAPSKEARTQIEYMMTRFTDVLNVELMGIVSTPNARSKMNKRLLN